MEGIGLTDLLQVRMDRTADSVRDYIKGLGPEYWNAFGDRFGFDVDLLLAQLDPIVNGRPRTAGTVCERCLFADYSQVNASRASDRGLDWDCPRCGGVLHKLYESDIPYTDILKLLRPRAWDAQVSRYDKGARP